MAADQAVVPIVMVAPAFTRPPGEPRSADTATPVILVMLMFGLIITGALLSFLAFAIGMSGKKRKNAPGGGSHGRGTGRERRR